MLFVPKKPALVTRRELITGAAALAAMAALPRQAKAAGAFNWMSTASSADLAGATSIQVGVTNVGTANGSISATDVLIAFVLVYGGAADPGTISTSTSGWTIATQVVSSTANSQTIRLAVATAAGSAGGTPTFTWATSDSAAWAQLDYTGLNSASPVDAAGSNAYENTSTALTANAITLSNPGDTLLWFTGWTDSTGDAITVPSGYTQRLNNPYLSVAQIAVGESNVNPSAGSTGTVSGSTASAGFHYGTVGLIGLNSGALILPTNTSNQGLLFR